MHPESESEPVVLARACALDDVVMRVSRVRYGAGTFALRVDVRQQAIEDKSYVDLDAEDAAWLVGALHRLLDDLT